MKPLIIFITLLILGINGFGQSKPKTTWQNNTVRLSEIYVRDGDVSHGTALNISSYAQQPQAMWIYSGTELMTRIEPKPNITKIDSLIIYVRKSQLRWLNDSTAVIHKSN